MAGPNQQPVGGASLSDILTTAKNVAAAIHAVAQGYLNVQGVQNTAQISAVKTAKTSAGRIARISVTTAGSTTGTVVDSPLSTATAPVIFVIPEDVGIYEVNLPTNFGLTIIPGTDQVLTVSWS